jgi:uncharacterized damage-inducible protein DinB
MALALHHASSLEPTMPMTYPVTAIADPEVPRAADGTLQHLIETYASETNKVYSTWTAFRDTDLAFKPHPKSSTIAEIMRHQLLSERRFFGEFLGTPEVPATEVLPAAESPDAFAARLLALARPRLAFLAGRPVSWWYERGPFFDVERERIWIFWRRVLHTAHHRTQLTVYQRLLDQPVLPTYGPTADVTWEGADPTLTVEAAARG